MGLNDSITSLKGVGGETAKKLEVLQLRTIRDLIDHWPRRYDDYSTITNIKDIAPGLVTIKATISSVRSRYARRGMHLTDALATDATGSLHIVWFNQPYRATSLKAGKFYFISGDFDMHSSRLSMINPTIELADELSDQKGRILAVYPETKGLKSIVIRKLVKQVLPLIHSLPETLPKWLVEEQKLLPRGEAIAHLHAPTTMEQLNDARRRLSFEELFQLQLASESVKRELAKELAPKIVFNEKVAKEFVAQLPFILTDDQRKVAWQILKDLDREVPANRLVEGDVGSGKTVVAALAAVMTLQAGYQVLYMAPTEILARQHAETLTNLLAHSKWGATIGLLVGSLKKSQKDQIHARIADGTCRFVVGTHALIQDKVSTNDVGLVIIDEQHRFGVDQRQKLRQKGGLFPHFVAMTATPIPRTLALTLYGELDLSIIGVLPSGRKPIETEIVQFNGRHQLYQKIDSELENGRQAFVVCPLISESSFLQAQAAETLYKDLQTKQLKHRRIGLLHGGMKAEDKDAVMKEFVDKNLDVLVSTTVIEVGVNVPNATVMIIEGAERFGLAQIHQLRGRIGRGEHQSYCYLVPSQDVGETKRLRAVASTTDGFKLAELDLELRGPGAIYGIRQSGVLDLRIAQLGDRKMVGEARKAAEEFFSRGESLLHYKYLSARVAHFRSVTRLN